MKLHCMIYVDKSGKKKLEKNGKRSSSNGLKKKSKC